MAASREAEDGVFRAAKDGLTRWLGRAREVVMAPWRQYKAAPNPANIASTVPLWQAQVDRILPALTPAQREGWAAAHLPGDFDPQDPFIQANLALTYNLLVRIPDEVHAMVVAAILQGSQKAESTEQIAKRVDDILTFTGSENWPSRAKTIAQTECFPGETEIDLALVTAAYRRWYEGDLFTVVTQNGNRLTATPNHPVLTANGWRALKDLTEDDYLVQDRGNVENAALGIDPDVKAKPALIAEIFDAVEAVGIVRRITGADPDFHGDGLDGDIDVVCTDGFLRFGVTDGLCQHCLDVVFVRPDFDRQSILESKCSSIEPASPAGLSLLSGSGGGSHDDTRLVQDPSHGRLRDAKILSDLRSTASGLVPTDNVSDVREMTGVADFRALDYASLAPWHIGVSQNSVNEVTGASISACDDIGTKAAEVLLDKVVSIEVRAWSGHVYNLSTVPGHYVAQRLIVANCNRHFNGSMLAHGLLREQAGESSLSKQWDTVMDNKERLEHREANNQIQPLKQPFIVGEEPLLFPGDPSGSPSNVINCRCSVRILKEGA